MFNAGAGNCHHGGHPAELYDTFIDQLATLPDDTLIYPGHDYIGNNLEFTLEMENEIMGAILDDGETNRSRPRSTIVFAQFGPLISSMKYIGIFLSESTVDNGSFSYNPPVRSCSSLSDLAEL